MLKFYLKAGFLCLGLSTNNFWQMDLKLIRETWEEIERLLKGNEINYVLRYFSQGC